MRSDITHIRYHTFDPAGNLTAIVSSETPTSLRPLIGRYLMNKLEVEQVGFVERPLNPGADVKFEMMAGEFCGNGLASAGALLCETRQAQDQLWLIESSPVESLVGVTSTRTSPREYLVQVEFEAFPFGRCRLSDEMERIDLEGISHLIVFVDDASDVSFDSAPALLESQGMPDVAALGVIFAYPVDGQWVIAPVVYVPAVQSLVEEHACASGSMALALALFNRGLVAGQSISVMQPAQEGIGISLDSVSQGQANLRLTVPVRALETGSLELNLFELFSV